MSSLVVKVCEFDTQNHPNADRLVIATPKGTNWQCIAQRDGLEGASSAVYIPIDSMLPYPLAKFLDIPDAKPGHGYRIRPVKIRGERGYGMLISTSAIKTYLAEAYEGSWLVNAAQLGETITVGTDVAEILGITKFSPPPQPGSITFENPAGFENCTDIESFKTFADVLTEENEVVVTEKIHGTSFKAGWVDADGDPKWWVGTKNNTVAEGAATPYTYVANQLKLKDRLQAYPGYTLYGEVFGPGIQKHFHYGEKDKGLRTFDVRRGLDFLCYDEALAFVKEIGLTPVPELYRGKWSMDLLKLADGPCYSGAHIREGMVVKPVQEMEDYKLGRVVLKIIGQKYHDKNYDLDEAA
jgi:RNA ligase (TIGR02306 family)